MKNILNIFKSKHFVSILFFLFCIGIVFYQVLFCGKTLTTGIVSGGVMGNKESENYFKSKDYELFNIIDRGGSAWQDEPLTLKVSNLYKKGLFPLWNRNAGFGRPLAADMMSLSFNFLRLPIFVNNSTGVFDIALITRIVLGGFFMYLFLTRIKISPLSAAVGSVIFILSGYFVYYANMGHLYVEVMIPLLLYSVERIVEKVSKLNLMLLIISLILMIVGGHPEAMVIAFLFATLYFIYRLVSKNEAKMVLKKKLAMYVLGVFFSIGLLCFLIVPFLEYYMNSDLGIHNSVFRVSLRTRKPAIFALQFFPVLIQSARNSFNNNYWSSIALVLLIIGFLNKKFRKIYLFFFIFSFFCVIKAYSKYLFSWIEYVPVFNNFVYYKYLQPEISFCFAVMSCIGLEFLRKKRKIIKALLVGLFVLVACYIYVFLNINMINYAFGPKHLYGAILIPVFFIILYFVLRKLSKKYKILKKYNIPFIFICFVSVFDLIIFSPKARPIRGNAYAIPEYVHFLNEDKEPYRIFSTDRIMYPATSSVFNIDDIRDLHAVYPRLYISYIKNFIDDSIVDRFSKYGVNTKIIENKFFDMANVKYVLSYRPLEVNIDTSLTKKIIEQNKLDIKSSLTWFNINKETKIVLFEHPPGIVRYKFTPDKDTNVLGFSLGMHPNIWESKDESGVWFQVNGLVDGKKMQLFKKYIDPKNNKNDRKWFENKLDLSLYVDKEITLEFITFVDGSNAHAWVGWGNLELISSINSHKCSENGQFTKVYDNEILIYENKHAFPRAFVVYNIDLEDNEESVIKRMKSDDFDPKKTAVVISDDVKLKKMENVDAENISKFEEEITYINQTDTNLELKTSTKENGYLIINDIYYEGWKVYVDGVPEHLYQTNLAFNGLFLSQGDHKIILKYEPDSYKIGLKISIFTLGIMTIFLLKKFFSKGVKR
jgi:Bacterial membrane protein YfhO